MTRFYFHLTSKQDNIPDDSGKELDTLIDAYAYSYTCASSALLQ
jgi:hypothetical protein